MTPTSAFAAAFLVTLALLVLVAWSGIRARRRIHIPAVGVTVASLVVTIVFAYRLGKVYDLASAGIITPIHLFLARAAAVAIGITALVGLRTLFVPRTLRAHKRIAWTSLSIVVLAAVTGVAMIALADPIQRP